MTLDELNQLDFKAMPDWPMATKLVAMGVIAVLVVTAGWWFLW